jgi:hypothetical protein
MKDVKCKKDPGEKLNIIGAEEKTKDKYKQGGELHQKPSQPVGNIGPPVLSAMSSIGRLYKKQQNKNSQTKNGPGP